MASPPLHDKTNGLKRWRSYFLKYYNYYQYNNDGFKPVRRILFSLILFLVCFFIYCVTLKLYPEVDMVIHSKCSNPLSSWDGKLFSWQIMTTSLHSRHEIYNLHFAKSYDDLIVLPHSEEPSKLSRPHRAHRNKTLIANSTNETQNKTDLRFLRASSRVARIHKPSSLNTRKIVIFGTHHKTGTYLAKKLFSKLCTKYQLCCQFHITRDSLYSVYRSIEEEPVDILGHNQWVWYPYELNLNLLSYQPTIINAPHQRVLNNNALASSLPAIDYKFIHFYRHPYYKIISSYHYHLAGSEKWNEKTLPFYEICPRIEQMLQQNNVVQSQFPHRKTKEECISELLYSKIENEESKTVSNPEKKEDCLYSSDQTIDRSLVFDYCESAYLCETCCRKEHEYAYSKEEYSSTPHLDTSLLSLQSKDKYKKSLPIGNHTNLGEMHVHQQGRYYNYQSRQLIEYQFLCQYLGQKIPQSYTLQQVLQQSSLLDGLLIEAALNYYEILRMAKIVNHTWSDPNSLNIDLETLTHEYDRTVGQFLHHLQPMIQSGWAGSTSSGSSSTEINDLAKDLSFYNLDNSFLYRWSMSNSFHNHVTNGQTQAKSTVNGIRENSTETKTEEKKGPSRKVLFELLATHPIVAKVYKPILNLLTSALVQ